jgi:molybdopterin-binding protein
MDDMRGKRDPKIVTSGFLAHKGRIISRQEGYSYHSKNSSSDVVSVLDGGNTVSAIVSNESAKRMSLKVGMKASAIFQAASILLPSRLEPAARLQ